MNSFPPQEQQISVMKSLIFNNGLMNRFMRHGIDTKISFVHALIMVFTELHKLDTFYNALNPADQDSLNATAGGNLLERRTQDVLTIIENKSNVRNSRNKSVVSQQMIAITTAMTAILKQFQVTPPPASDKAVKEICVTCGGAHPYYQCLAAGGNTFPEFRDNIQGNISAAVVNYNQGNSVYRPPAAVNYNQGNSVYRPPGMANQIRPPGSGSLPGNTIANPKGELKAITIQSGVSINLIPLSVWKKLGLPELIFTRMTLELANRAICTPAGIARDVFILVGKFTFLGDFVIVDYESDPRVPIILGRPFLRIARALIDVYSEEMILRDGDKRLTLNMRHDTLSYSNQPQKESINLINVFNNSSKDFLEDLFSNQPSGNPTFHPELTSPKVNDDIFDSEGGNVLPKKLLDLDSTKDLHPPLHGEKIKETKLLIDELDLPCDFLPSEYDSFISQDFSRVDALPSTNSEDKVFNPGILSQEKPFEIITRVVQDKKLAISNASLMLEDFDPPFYEPLFFKEVPMSKMLLPFSSKNKEKVFKPGNHTSEKVHSSFIPELSHQGYKIFKINQILKAQ
nr:reverse transcriptase domain-containing protein [Tanacetum cinerariifolium]